MDEPQDLRIRRTPQNQTRDVNEQKTPSPRTETIRPANLFVEHARLSMSPSSSHLQQVTSHLHHTGIPDITCTAQLPYTWHMQSVHDQRFLPSIDLSNTSSGPCLCGKNPMFALEDQMFAPSPNTLFIDSHPLSSPRGPCISGENAMLGFNELNFAASTNLSPENTIDRPHFNGTLHYPMPRYPWQIPPIHSLPFHSQTIQDTSPDSCFACHHGFMNSCNSSHPSPVTHMNYAFPFPPILHQTFPPLCSVPMYSPLSLMPFQRSHMVSTVGTVPQNSAEAQRKDGCSDTIGDGSDCDHVASQNECRGNEMFQTSSSALPLSSSSERASNSNAPKNDLEDKTYSCRCCPQFFSTTSGINRHCVSHCREQKFVCKICNKAYNSSSNLKVHSRTHSLPHKCETCGKRFSRSWLLQGHIRTHTGEKPFKCTTCNKCFADKSNLKVHTYTHTGVRRYQCQMCGRSFSRMAVFLRHKQYFCPMITRLKRGEASSSKDNENK